MNPQRPNVEEIFFQAIPKKPAERLAFLAATCSDSATRTRVEALLKAHDCAGDFLESPAIGPAVSPACSQTLHALDDDTTLAHEALGFLDPCDTPNRLGRLAYYEILEILGRGGMGIVLRGIDVKLNRVVAIKVMSPQLATDDQGRKRFLREAQAAAAISHQHVVAIHAVDEFKGLPYLVMEHVSGSSLQQKIDGGGPLELEPILRFGLQIALGLGAAHTHGLVHRDIKPANILLEEGNSRVKISDFGLARSVNDVSVTQVGRVYGTPLFMSPEQAKGERVDQRSDLFSLGSVLYAMCTGRPPFRGESGFAVLKQVCDEAPRPIREVNPEIPAALAKIIDKLLAKNPECRFQTADDVAGVLSRYLTQVQNAPHAPIQPEGQTEPFPIRAAGAGHRSPKLVGAAVLLAALVVLAVLVGARVANLAGLGAPSVATANRDAPLVSTIVPAAPSKRSKHLPGATDRPVKVFILAGDSNMAGRVEVRLLKANPARTKQYFQHLLDDGRYLVRKDVWIKNFSRKGNLTVGFGQTPDRIGPELEFGQVVGDYFDEQVLLIKTCWGGHKLSVDFRSPSSGPVPGDAVEDLWKNLRAEKADATLADAQAACGRMYRDMLTEVRQTLATLGELFPAYQGQGFELAGFVWFSGWSDMVSPTYCYGYQSHLGNLIRDVRADLNMPKLPFLIGQMGVNKNKPLNPEEVNFRSQQAAVADLPEFVDNVKLVVTDPFWDDEAYAVYEKGWKEHLDEWDQVGSDHPYHYLGSAKTTCLIGRAFGEAMIQMCGSGSRN